MKTRTDLIIKDSESLLNLPEDLIQYAIPANVNHNYDSIEATQVMATLSHSCRKMYALFKPELEKRGAKTLLTNVVQGNEAAAIKIAQTNPGLFFIESSVMDYAMDLQGNRRKIEGWTPYQALFAGDVEMLAKVRPYLYTYLETLPNGFELAIKQELEKFPHGFEFPPCTDDFNQLLTEFEAVISNDQQLKQNWNNPTPKTHSLLEQFRNHFKLGNVKTGHHFNMNNFIKVHGVYDKHFSENTWNWKQHDFYYVYVIGFLERLLTAFYLQRACQGGFENLQEPLKRNFKVMNHVTGKEITVVPLDLDSACRLGEDYAVDTDYGIARGEHFQIEGWCPSYFEKLCQSHTMRYQDLSFSQSYKNEVIQKKQNKGFEFQKVFYGASTGHSMRNLYQFLQPKDRARLSTTCKDAHRFAKVNQALTQVSFKEKLMEDILRVLESKKYKQKLKVYRNPSGFLRLNDVIKDLDSQLLGQLPEASNIRLNFWPGEIHANLGASFSLETRHSHPRSFCSFIVSGGYEHHLYLVTDNHSDKPIEVVKVTVSPDGKKFVLQSKPEYQSSAINEKIIEKSDGYAYFSTSLIHEVTARIPAAENIDEGTLSINVVFKADSKDIPEYNLYFQKYDKTNIVESYTALLPKQAEMTLDIVKNLLKRKVEEMKCKYSEIRELDPAPLKLK